MGRHKAAVVFITVCVLAMNTGVVLARRAEDSACKRILDATIPAGLKIAHSVDFEVGRNTLAARDRIEIKEVLGTTDRFAVGEVYLVRGEYTLGSADSAILTLSVTAASAEEGCTTNNPLGRTLVRRGKGTFEMATPILFPGYPHVWLDTTGQNVADPKSGGVYFGSGEFLQK